MAEAFTAAEVLKRLRALADPSQKEGMARFGIRVDKAFGGVRSASLKKLAREIGKNHRLAAELWKTGVHEARHIAFLIEEPEKVTERQMERWAKEFDSWDIVDGCSLYCFRKTQFARPKVVEWSRREEEFVKRTAFSLMAVLAVHDQESGNHQFTKFLPIIRRESTDERNFVKKAVNWALRQIGKRNLQLNRAAIRTAKEIRALNSRSARWIAADALRELTSEPVRKRLRGEKT